MERGLHTFYLGDEAIVDCPGFSLKGKKWKSVRQSAQRVERTYHFEMMAETDASPELIAALNDLSAKWRGKAPERGFTMTLSRDVEGINPEFRLCVALDEHDQPGGFLRIVPVYGDATGYTLDLMRRDPDTPNGMTEFLLTRTIMRMDEDGFERLSMNFAAWGRLFYEDIHYTRAPAHRQAAARADQPLLPDQVAQGLQPALLPELGAAVIVYDDVRALPRVGLLYGGVEGFLGIPVIGRYFLPRTVPHVKPLDPTPYVGHPSVTATLALAPCAVASSPRRRPTRSPATSTRSTTASTRSSPTTTWRRPRTSTRCWSTAGCAGSRCCTGAWCRVWAKDPKVGNRMINARAETLATKNAFKPAFRKRRCIIPADGFYEWKVVPGQKDKQPMYIHRPDDEPHGLRRAVGGVEGPGRPGRASCTRARSSPARPTRRWRRSTTGCRSCCRPSAWETWLDPTVDDLDLLGKFLVPAPPELIELRPGEHRGQQRAQPGPPPARRGRAGLTLTFRRRADNLILRWQGRLDSPASDRVAALVGGRRAVRGAGAAVAGPGPVADRHARPGRLHPGVVADPPRPRPGHHRHQRHQRVLPAGRLRLLARWPS